MRPSSIMPGRARSAVASLAALLERLERGGADRAVAQRHHGDREAMMSTATSSRLSRLINPGQRHSEVTQKGLPVGRDMSLPSATRASGPAASAVFDRSSPT
jgi:hypothetical protein